MKPARNNYAFIDSQNLNLNIRTHGWILDFRRFHVYLKEHYSFTKAFLFIGYLEENKKLYDFLKHVGYTCIFKPTLEHKMGEVKGNCDVELVLHTMIEFPHFDQAVIVTGDGDFHCLADYLADKSKLHAILIPNKLRFSALLRFRKFRKYLRFMNDLRQRLEYKKEKAS